MYSKNIIPPTSIEAKKKYFIKYPQNNLVKLFDFN